MLSYGNAQEQNGAVRTSEVQNRDKEFSRYLMENAGQDLVACLFQREDTLQDAAAVLSLSVADVTEAERMLRALVNTAPADEGRKTPRITFCYTVNKAYLVYRLPQTILFKQLTSFVEPTLDVMQHFMADVCYSLRMRIACRIIFANWIKGKCLMGQWLIRRAWITCPIHIILC